MDKTEIIMDMVMCGYALMGRTVEGMAKEFTLEQLLDMRDNFFRYLGIQ